MIQELITPIDKSKVLECRELRMTLVIHDQNLIITLVVGWLNFHMSLLLMQVQILKLRQLFDRH